MKKVYLLIIYHFTIGFSTAVNTACEAIEKLRDTSTSHQRCSIIEVMGRHCGDLALYSGICCGAEYIFTNDTGLDKERLLASLKADRLAGRKHAIVVISENMVDVTKNSTTTFISSIFFHL